MSRWRRRQRIAPTPVVTEMPAPVEAVAVAEAPAPKVAPEDRARMDYERRQAEWLEQVEREKANGRAWPAHAVREVSRRNRDEGEWMPGAGYWWT